MLVALFLYSSWFYVVLIFNYKVFLLCSVITLSVYLLLVKIDGSPSKFFHLFHKSYTCHFAKHFVSNITFCYGLFIYEMQLISDIFFMPSLSLYILRYRVKQEISFIFYKYWNSMYLFFQVKINIQWLMIRIIAVF